MLLLFFLCNFKLNCPLMRTYIGAGSCLLVAGTFASVNWGQAVFSLQLFFFLFFDAERGVPGRAGPGQTHRLHVILQGGVWLKKTFQDSCCTIWDPTVPSRSHGATGLRFVHIWDISITWWGSFRKVNRCSSDNGRHSVCATGGQEGCSGWWGERSGWCSAWAAYWREGIISFPHRFRLLTCC